MGKRIDNTSCHCLKMRRSAENVITFYDRFLAPSGVTARQYSLLYAVSGHQGCNVRELAEVTLLDRSTLARSLKPLIQAGYIRDGRKEGARDSVLELTEQGTAVLQEAAARWTAAQRQFESRLGQERLKALEELLELLQEL